MDLANILDPALDELLPLPGNFFQSVQELPRVEHVAAEVALDQRRVEPGPAGPLLPFHLQGVDRRAADVPG